MQAHPMLRFSTILQLDNLSILEKNQQYYKLNRDKILEKNKAKRYICECGTECKFYARNKHFNTRKHQSFINAQKEAIA